MLNATTRFCKSPNEPPLLLLLRLPPVCWNVEPIKNYTPTQCALNIQDTQHIKTTLPHETLTHCHRLQPVLRIPCHLSRSCRFSLKSRNHLACPRSTGKSANANANDATTNVSAQKDENDADDDNVNDDETLETLGTQPTTTTMTSTTTTNWAHTTTARQRLHGTTNDATRHARTALLIHVR